MTDGPRSAPGPRRQRGRTKASVQSRSAGFEYSHLDLENLVVALLASSPVGYPNALHELGYRLHHFDAGISLIPPKGQARNVKPDAVAHHETRNLALVIECKTGTGVGFHQLPEGSPETQDEWARALSLPARGVLAGSGVEGVIVSSSKLLEPKSAEIEAKGLTWVRVDQTLRVDPDHLSDARVAKAITKLPAKPWPRAFVPFSHDPADGLDMVVAAVGPLVIQAASRGSVYVYAEETAHLTHNAVWNVTDKDRHAGWTRVVANAFDALAADRLRGIATYERNLRRLRLHHVREGERPPEYRLRALRRGIALSHAKVQSSRTRVRRSKVGPLQTTMFDEDEL